MNEEIKELTKKLYEMSHNYKLPVFLASLSEVTAFLIASQNKFFHKKTYENFCDSVKEDLKEAAKFIEDTQNKEEENKNE